MVKQPLLMNEIQKVSLHILKTVTNICESQGFRYYLAYGTLIGAIRHKGFIPWDDDVDILMPRPDYEKLLRYLESRKEEIYPLAVFNRNTNKKYFYGITRICDMRYEIDKDNEQNCGMGIFIDVYPYDGLGDDESDALSRLTESSNYMKDVVLATRKRLDVSTEMNWKGKIVYVVKWCIHHLLGPNYYFNKQKKLFEGLPAFDDSRYVAPLSWYFTKPDKVLFVRDIFMNPVKMTFEKYEFYVPGQYDKMLRQEYGDYMELPPENKRVYHHQYKAYKKD